MATEGKSISQLKRLPSDEGELLIEVSFRRPDDESFHSFRMEVTREALEGGGGNGAPIDLDDLLNADQSVWQPILRDVIITLKDGETGQLMLEDGQLKVVPDKTKDELGLDQVDNTADADKPLSEAMKQALLNKVDNDELAAQLGDLLAKSDIVDALDSGRSDKALSARQGRLLKEQLDALDAVFGENADLDEIAKIIEDLLANKEALEGIKVEHVEGLQDALDLIYASLESLEKEKDLHAGRLDALESSGEQIDTDMKALDGRVKDAEDSLTALGQRLDNVEDEEDKETGDITDADWTDVKDRLKALEDNAPADWSDAINDLINRVEQLENATGDAGTGDSDALTAFDDRLKAVESALIDKVDKQDGKSLSTHNFSDYFRDALQDLIDNPPSGGGQDGADGRDGVDGKDGKSAYELAVDNGETRSLEEWLDSLPGKDGKDATGGSGGGGGNFVKARHVFDRGGLEGVVILVGFGTQDDIDAVTVSESQGGSTYTLGNLPENLTLYSMYVTYMAGFNTGTKFEVIYPDNWGNVDQFDMVIPSMVYYSATNPGVIQAQVNIGYTNDRNGLNSIIKTGLVANQPFQWAIRFM